MNLIESIKLRHRANKYKNKDEVLKNMNDQISRDAKLQIDFDKYQYEKIFNQEMEKFNSGK